MRLKIVLLIIALMIPVQAAASSSSIGVGANPGNMSFKLAPATSAEQSLYVTNTGSEAATYEIYIDNNNYKDWFTFSSSSFDLEAGEIKEVKVTLKVPATAEANADCEIKISRTMSGKAVGASVVIPAHVEIFDTEMSYSEGDSPGSSPSGGIKSFQESFNRSKVKEMSQQLVANSSSLINDSKQDITSAGEKLKASSESWKEAANKSLDNATVSLDKVTRKFEDTGRRIENTKERIENTKERIEDTKERFEDTREKFKDTKERFKNLNIIYEDIILYIDNIIKTCLAKINQINT